MNDRSAFAHSWHAGSACAVAHPEESSWLRGVWASEKDATQRRVTFCKKTKKNTKDVKKYLHKFQSIISINQISIKRGEEHSLRRVKRGGGHKELSDYGGVKMAERRESEGSEGQLFTDRRADTWPRSLCRPLVARQEECLVTRWCCMSQPKWGNRDAGAAESCGSSFWGLSLMSRQLKCSNNRG